jgi:hypothetical protein
MWVSRITGLAPLITIFPSSMRTVAAHRNHAGHPGKGDVAELRAEAPDHDQAMFVEIPLVLYAAAQVANECARKRAPRVLNGNLIKDRPRRK